MKFSVQVHSTFRSSSSLNLNTLRILFFNSSSYRSKKRYNLTSVSKHTVPLYTVLLNNVLLQNSSQRSFSHLKEMAFCPLRTLLQGVKKKKKRGKKYIMLHIAVFIKLNEFRQVLAKRHYSLLSSTAAFTWKTIQISETLEDISWAFTVLNIQSELIKNHGKNTFVFFFFLNIGLQNL